VSLTDCHGVEHCTPAHEAHVGGHGGPFQCGVSNSDHCGHTCDHHGSYQGASAQVPPTCVCLTW
jgi:hypothetical protein